MRLDTDRRGVSEMAGVAVLIGITVLVLAFLGIGVLFTADEDQQQLEFRYVYSNDLKQLTVIYEDDKELQAGNVYVDGPGGNVTWAELASTDDNSSIQQVNTVFINEEGFYGTTVGENDYFRIYHAPEGAEGSIISERKSEHKGNDDIGDTNPLDEEDR